MKLNKMTNKSNKINFMLNCRLLEIIIHDFARNIKTSIKNLWNGKNLSKIFLGINLI